MKELTIFLLAVVLFAAAWWALARRWRRNGRNALISHLGAAVASFVISTIFLVVAVGVAIDSKEKPAPALGSADSTAPSDVKISSSPASAVAISSTAAVTTSKASSDTVEVTEALPPGVHYLAVGNWFGCQSEEELARINGYSVAGDKDAFRKAATAAIANEECAIFEGGEKVALVDVTILRGTVKIRRFGDTVEYWTNREAISTAK